MTMLTSGTQSTYLSSSSRFISVDPVLQVYVCRLMVISHTGPTPGQFPFRCVVYDWYKASDHRETLSVAFQNKLDVEFGLVPKDKGKAHKDKAENTPMAC